VLPGMPIALIAGYSVELARSTSRLEFLSEVPPDAIGAPAATLWKSKHLLNDEQSEKRYVRLLETIAGEALVPGAPQFHTRLEEALGMIVEAMNAQSAALLLFDPTRQTLLTAASVGAAEEQLEHYARPPSLVKSRVTDKPPR
jgi:hypothetical protein